MSAPRAPRRVASSRPAPGAPAKRGPGRPRSVECQAAVLRATAELLDERRYGELTMEAIAKRAGVAKQTLYKWWPSRARIVMEAYRERVGDTIRIADTGKLERDLERIVVETAVGLRREGDGQHGLGAVLAGLIADAQDDPELLEEFRTTYFAPRRARVAALLEGAIARGELPPVADMELVLDSIYGPLWIRLLVGHQPLDAKLAKGVLTNVLRGLRADTPRRRTTS